MTDDKFKTYAAIASAIVVAIALIVAVNKESGPAGRESIITPATPLLSNNPCIKVKVLPAGPVYIAQEVKIDKKNGTIVLKIDKYRTVTLSTAQGNVQIDDNPVNCIGSYY